MNFPNTRANEVILILTSVVAWLMIACTLRRFKYDFTSWISLVSCFGFFLTAIFVGLSWMPPETFNCTKNCFPWGN